MKILYKGCVSNINIVGYFSDVQVILDSLRITYGQYETLKLYMPDPTRVQVISNGELVEIYYIEEGFLCTKPDHL